LLSFIGDLPVIDCHEHMAGPDHLLRFSEPIAALIAGYYASDLISAGLKERQLAFLRDDTVATGEKWPLFQAYWERSQHTAYARVAKLVMRDVYGERAMTLAAVERLGLVHLHVFPYSPRPGTPAARMPQVAPETRQVRGKALRAAGERMFRRRLRDRTGTMAAILVEGEGGLGWTEDYLPAAVPGAAPGSIVERRVEAVGRRLCAA